MEKLGHPGRLVAPPLAFTSTTHQNKNSTASKKGLSLQYFTS
jgi:hypothetical protein